MKAESVLRPEVLTRLEQIGRADLVVGVPSYNNARTIGHVVRAITAGLSCTSCITHANWVASVSPSS